MHIIGGGRKEKEKRHPSPDGLLSLGLAHLGLLVPLGQDLGERSTSDRPLELYSAACAFLSHLFLFGKKQRRQLLQIKDSM